MASNNTGTNQQVKHHENKHKLEGLSEKIFLDRYAWKDADSNHAKVGDIVLVLTKGDPKFPVKEVGEIVERQAQLVKVRTRSDTIIETHVEKLTLTIEKTPEEMWDRLARAMAAVESTPEQQAVWEKKFRLVLDDWKLVPGGRIAAGAGASNELTLFNCYVIPSPQDSRGGIMKTLTEMTEIMARGGGVGINLSSLRPRRAVVKGVNGSSSGSVSWGGLFSYTTGLIEQGGSRRGALMLMMNDWHPDVLDFITVKQTMGQVTNANLSVCVSNAFMEAVKQDGDWELVFPDTSDPDYDSEWDGDLGKWKASGRNIIPYRTVKAREIWHTIIESAWKSAEPGVVFMEYYNQMSNSWYFNPIICTNPCFHPKTRIATQYGLITIEDLYRRKTGEFFMVGTDNRLIEKAKVVGGRSYEIPGLQMRSATVFPTGKKETIKIHLQNGIEISVTPEHQLYTNFGWKQAKNLDSEDYVYIQSAEGGFAEEDQLGEEWGLFLGWLIGDGWVSVRGEVGMVFGADDEEVIPHLIDVGEKISGIRAKIYQRTNGTKQVYWWRKNLVSQLASIGVTSAKGPEKVVPELIFTSSKKTVTAFLQALFSADGTVYERDEMHRTARLTSSSKKLLQGVQLLLLNYGINSSIYARPKSSQSLFNYTTKGGEFRTYQSKGFYELIISGNNLLCFKEKIGFKYVTRKQQALERIARPSRKSEKFMSRVKKLEKGEYVTVYDITEPVTHSLIAGGVVAHNCGEQGLPGWGVCNLSAINLSKFYDETNHDVAWEELAETTRISARFLDNVIDATPYHFEENRLNQQRERRVGLGTMGLAELMIKLRIRYGSLESLDFLNKLYGFMAKEAYLASAEIAAEKGAFPAFEAEPYLQSGFMRQMTATYPEVGEAIRQKGIRNVTLITQAPTGSTGTMVGTSTGIEPYFAFKYFRQSRLGYDEQFVPIAEEWLEQHPGESLPDYYVTAMDLSAENHIRVQAAIQKWVDSSISKTANCPADFTVQDTAELYELAFDLGCKGVTIYRDGSRDVQVLSTSKKEDTSAIEEQNADKEEFNSQVAESVSVANPVYAGRESSLPDLGEQTTGVVDKQYKRRPQVLRGATYKMHTPFGMAYITINDLDGTPGEIFLNVGKAGSDVFAMAEALGRVCSLFLRYGYHGHKVELLIKHLKGIGGSGAIGFGANRVESIADAVAKALESHVQMNEDIGVKNPNSAKRMNSSNNTKEVLLNTQTPTSQLDDAGGEGQKTSMQSIDLCPSCGSASLINVEGCKTCSNCGYSKCN
ncbi:ribonucleoside-diphosphate reductase alpha chain [Paenibacillus polysaccharolyticus]|uniref:Vitamin B12-dependent ribonucleotide reductase n=1 Tax=Paenibacillus polysaccharolyticus TaxID=582692 RepID=A0A1G5L9E1_9BACL|nr:LAGLIDADG family homing endonuclease [Paenibacillus polysaccharolyticus]SCZ09446.1 ribonucleoside-diphosphate reductase alpha chain [Paenibacillus polysaccharolyticus]